MCVLFFVLLEVFTVFCLNQKTIMLFAQVFASYNTTEKLGNNKLKLSRL